MSYDMIFDALGDPTRRLVFEQLRQGPQAVAALAAGLPVTRPAVSQHLKVLKQAGLVSGDAVGTRRIYRLNQKGLAALRAWLEGLSRQIDDGHQAEIQRQLNERKST